MSLLAQLNQLESAGLVQLAQFEPDLEYLFRHALVQEAAYASLLNTDRKRLHRAVGHAVERLFSNRIDDLSPALAYHFERAGDLKRAHKYYRLAGKNAFAIYANQEAEAYLQKALAYTNDLEKRGDLFEKLGEVVNRQSRQREAIDIWRQGITTYLKLRNWDQVARIYSQAARAAWYIGDTPGGLEICLEGLDICADAPDNSGIAMLIHETGRAYFFNGNSEKAYELCQQALDLSMQLGALDVQADTLTTIGVIPDRPLEESLAALEEAVRISEENSYLQIAHRAHHNLANALIDKSGDYEAARKHYQRSVEINQMRGSQSAEIFTRISLLGLSVNQMSIDHVKKELAVLEEMIHSLPGSQYGSIEITTFHAILALFEGRPEEALSILREGAAQTRRTGNLQNLYGILNEIAWIQIEQANWGQSADLEEAEACAIELFEASGLKGEDKALTILVALYSQQGKIGIAEEYLQKLRELSKQDQSIWKEFGLLTAEAYFTKAQNDWDHLLEILEKFETLATKYERWLDYIRIQLHISAAHLERGNPADLEQALHYSQSANSLAQQKGIVIFQQIASLLESTIQIKIQSQAAQSQQALQEMAVAGRVQERFLPKNPPQLTGWQIAAMLKPARQTSGDFYDFLELPSGIAVMIADVADKGAGAALFMSLARALLRTFAPQYPDQPAKVLSEVNRRILTDTSQALFVTGVYALLDPETGNLTYCNAGHNPPYLLRSTGEILTLPRTGMPLGVEEGTEWQVASTTIEPGDRIVFFTDGFTEAQNSDGRFYGEACLLESLLNLRNLDAQEFVQGVQDDLNSFVGIAPQGDDITMVVLYHEP